MPSEKVTVSKSDSEEIEVKIEEETSPEPKEAPSVKPSAKSTSSEPFENRVPSDWNIKPNDDGTITAISMVGTEKYEGTIEGFNARLKG